MGPFSRFLSSLVLVLMTATITSSQSESKETYEIYDAVIRKMFAGDKVTFDMGGPKVSQLVIRDHTIRGYASGENEENWDVVVKPRLKQLSDDTIADFASKVKTSIIFERKFGTHLPYKLITKQELDSFFGDRNWDVTTDKWKKFHEVYHGSLGYISFSNIGFNRSKDKALVYFVHWCGPVCGTGHYILLSKHEERWEVLGHAQIWIS